MTVYCIRCGEEQEARALDTQELDECECGAGAWSNWPPAAAPLAEIPVLCWNGSRYEIASSDLRATA